jgi:FtsH-binding integral membrane protein
MAEFNTIPRSGVGVRTAEIDAGLRAHMNKVYGTMSVGMLITALAAWAISGLATTTDPSAAVARISETMYLTQFGMTIYAIAAEMADHVRPADRGLRLFGDDQPDVGSDGTDRVLRFCRA